MSEPAPQTPLRGRTGRIVVGLSICQMVGWGTTYNMIATMWRPVAAELAVSRDLLFTGPLAMLLVAALISPAVGRMIDERGAREFMIAGTFVLAGGLALMAASPNLAVFVLAWAIIGAGTPLVLNNAVFAMIAVVAGAGARRAMTVVTLFGAMSSTIGWPLSVALDEALGWRGTFLAFAAMHLAICLPIQLALPRHDEARAGGAAGGEVRDGLLPQEVRAKAALLFAVATAIQGLVSWGTFLNFITFLERLGHAPAAALWLAALIGPASIAARLVDFFGSKRFRAVDLALAAFCAMLASLVLVAGAGTSFAGALIATILYGASTGFISLARATVPLELFGPKGYATLLGRFALPQNLAFAASPVVFAVLVERGGVDAALWVAVIATAVSTAAFTALWRMTGRAP